MATPEQIYASDVYRLMAEGNEPVPSAWFKDVYDALGIVLRRLTPAPADGAREWLENEEYQEGEWVGNEGDK